MISVTKLLGGASYFGDRLRYHDDSARQTTGARPDAGPVVVWNATKTCNLECVHCYADAEIRKFSGELTTAEAETMIRDLGVCAVEPNPSTGGLGRGLASSSLGGRAESRDLSEVLIDGE
jgi:hypothetical protein